MREDHDLVDSEMAPLVARQRQWGDPLALDLFINSYQVVSSKCPKGMYFYDTDVQPEDERKWFSFVRTETIDVCYDDVMDALSSRTHDDYPPEANLLCLGAYIGDTWIHSRNPRSSVYFSYSEAMVNAFTGDLPSRTVRECHSLYYYLCEAQIVRCYSDNVNWLTNEPVLLKRSDDPDLLYNEKVNWRAIRAIDEYLMQGGRIKPSRIFSVDDEGLWLQPLTDTQLGPAKPLSPWTPDIYGRRRTEKKDVRPLLEMFDHYSQE